LKKTSDLLFFLAALWILTLLILGGWWIHIILSMSYQIEELQKFAPSGHKALNVERMIVWEGGTFFVIIILLTILLLLFYFKDLKKTRALSTFFAGLTHELKTPLASIRLQADVLQSKLETIRDEGVQKLLARLTWDVLNLETQMEKVLQLSRLERGGDLNLLTLSLQAQIEQVILLYEDKLKAHFEPLKTNPLIWADEFALNLILKNIFENTLRHSGSNEIFLTLKESAKEVDLQISDNGTFSGDPGRLGELFYKHHSAKGSGIGLYLIKTLMKKMKGFARTSVKQGIIYTLTFERSFRED